MIVLKNPQQLAAMKEAGTMTADALRVAGKAIEQGITSAEIDNIVRNYIVKQGGIPSCLHYNGFPASTCISVNNAVIHGIPGSYKIKSGDIVSIDLCVLYRGWQGDSAATFPCGEITEQAQNLIDATRESMFQGIAAAKAGSRLGDVGHAVQQYVEDRGFSVVRQFVGHGIGKEMHEEPDVPNYGKPGHGLRLVPGMVITVEPMINEGEAAVKTMPDGWTVKTCDGRLSAHFENTIAITEDGPVILTVPTRENQ